MKKILMRLWYDSVPVLACFAALTAAVWGRAQRNRAEGFEQLADEYASICVNACSRCSSELKDAVTDMSFSLDKLRVTASDAGRVLALEDIARSSASAVGLLTRLPRSQVDVMELESFLARAGDYARSLSGGLLAGREPAEKDIEQLEAVLEACRALADTIEERILNGEMPIGTEEFDYYEASADADDTEYPALDYDGPYAAAVGERAPKCGGEAEADPALALEFARCIAEEEMFPAGETGGVMPCLDFSNADGTVTVSVTRNGMHPVSFMRLTNGNAAAAPDESGLSLLIETAKRFLDRLGFEDMTPVFTRFFDGAAEISFAYQAGDTLVLGDSVRVKLDIASGEAIGLDAREYFFNHCERELSRPAVSAEEAKKAVSASLEITRERLALLPVTPLTEKLCWEFRGEGFGGEYLIYVNAQTGAEEKVVRIVTDEFGESRV